MLTDSCVSEAVPAVLDHEALPCRYLAIMAAHPLDYVENFFDALDDPDKADSPILTAAEIEIKATKLTLAIADELRCPDIIVLVEIEEALVINGDADGHVPGTEVTALVPRLAARGCPYRAMSREGSDDRSIEVGFM